MQIFIAVLLTFLVSLGLFGAAFYYYHKKHLGPQLNDSAEENNKLTELQQQENYLLQNIKKLENDEKLHSERCQNLNTSYQTSVEKYNLALDNLQEEKSKLEAAIRNDYAQWKDAKELDEKEISALIEKKTAIEAALSQLDLKFQSFNDECKRIEEEKERLKNEHKSAIQRSLGQSVTAFQLVFSKQEFLELDQLGKVIPLLSNPAPLNKVIYEMYYRDKMKQIISQAGLDRRFTGIYRLFMDIDGVETSYVGQSVDIGNRWQQHLKRFVGSEPTTGIRLYRDDRIDLSKLKWEVVEEVPDQGLLNEREKYWIEFYNCGGGWNSK